MSKLKNVGLSPAKILLPKDNFNKWAVVACDQYTSEPEYWQRVDEYVGDAASALRIMLPEVYLEEDDLKQRQENTIIKMDEYLQSGVFQDEIEGLIYVERQVDKGWRKGLMACVDLEEYDYTKGSVSLIRATEDTIEDRLPPRVAIRQKASLEVPHVMLLIDDEEDIIFSEIDESKSESDVVYDFMLMEGGGHIRGYKVKESLYDRLAAKLETLKSKNDGFLFAVGDGNHSLATAKKCWELIKPSLSKNELKDHPARYALVEIVNLHDETLVFESIHRLLENVGDDDMDNIAQAIGLGDDLLPYYRNGGQGMFLVNYQNRLCAAVLQEGLTRFMAENPDVKIDYIHGDDTAQKLSLKEHVITFILPAFDKKALFSTVIADGALPRKSFSMGHAHEKRFYLEARIIKKDAYKSLQEPSNKEYAENAEEICETDADAPDYEASGEIIQ
ncbi:MAG: DUF1015 domain-containing protein [Clostridia bacterium]|nr:DUF1015 domain-containing protein [Clostridia bacterium]